MEPLTDEEMLEIEGGDWYGIGFSFMYAMSTAMALI